MSNDAKESDKDESQKAVLEEHNNMHSEGCIELHYNDQGKLRKIKTNKTRKINQA